jgi:ribonuclease J
MAEQARFALAQGAPSAIYQKNGDVIRLAPNGPEKVGEARSGRLVLDGDVILPADGSTVNERRRIAVNGLITVVVPVDAEGRLAGALVVRPFGVPIEQDRDDFLADAADAGRRAIGDSAVDNDKVREAIRLAVRRCATLWTGKKPIVEVMPATVTR